MNSEQMSFLRHWARVNDENSPGQSLVREGKNGRQGFVIDETPDFVVRRVFEEQRQGSNRTLRVLEHKEGKDFGVTRLSKAVLRQSSRRQHYTEGWVKRLPQGATLRYDVETLDDGYLYHNSGGGGSWEEQVFQRFRDEFEERWQTVVSGNDRRRLLEGNPL